MEVDPPHSSSGATLLPLIDEEGALSTIASKHKIMGVLDKLEDHVEQLRKAALQLEEEKDSIMATIDSIRTLPGFIDLTGLDKDEASRYLERIYERCMTVDVKVYTQRDKSQEDALHQVNHLIDHLVMGVRHDSEGAKLRCMTYINSCSSQSHGVTDKHFESVLLGCTVDDQKHVKKRLQGLLKYIEKFGIVTEVE